MLIVLLLQKYSIWLEPFWGEVKRVGEPQGHFFKIDVDIYHV